MHILLTHLLNDLAIPLASALPKPLAYLDPGSGSFILQILLASLLASLLFLKSFWRKVIGIFRKPDPTNEDETLDDDNDQDLP